MVARKNASINTMNEIASLNVRLIRKAYTFLSNRLESKKLFNKSSDPVFQNNTISGYFDLPVSISWNILYSALDLLAPDNMREGGINFCIMCKTETSGRPTKFSFQTRCADRMTPMEEVLNELEIFLEEIHHYVIQPLNTITEA